jgi:hypothetical protein
MPPRRVVRRAVGPSPADADRSDPPRLQLADAHGRSIIAYPHAASLAVTLRDGESRHPHGHGHRRTHILADPDRAIAEPDGIADGRRLPRRATDILANTALGGQGSPCTNSLPKMGRAGRGYLCPREVVPCSRIGKADGE